MRALAVIERDLRKFRRNPLVILASLLLPIIYILILGNSFQGTLRHLPVVVVNRDDGPYARKVMELLQALASGPRTIAIRLASDPAWAREQVRQGYAKGALIIPASFSRDVVRGARPEVGFLVDNSDSISANVLEQTLNAAMADLAVEYVPIREDIRVPRIRSVELYRKVDYDASLVPGAVVMAIFMGTMTTGAFNLVMDRFLGVHESYLSTPLTRRDIVVGILVSGVFVTTLVATVVLLIGVFLTGVTLIGGALSFLWLVLVIVLTALGLLSMMCIILSRVSHPRIVGLFGGFLNVIFYFPSGAVYPVESFPPWLRAFARVNPETYAVHALRSLIFKGVGFEAIRWDLGFLLLFTTAMLALATVSFKRRL
jgi:ABC-2 type transport system permease protein